MLAILCLDWMASGSNVFSSLNVIPQDGAIKMARL